MYNKYLKPLYHEIFGKEFNYNDSEDRLIMQHIVYLCLTMGAPIGSYNFRYSTLHGPVSSSLSDDMLEISKRPDYQPPFFGFSSDSLFAINNVEKLIRAGVKSAYNTSTWLECLCSIIYLKKFVLSSLNTDTTELFETMKKYQPHLNDDKSNKRAYALVKNL